jgi:hypothetical protein
MGEAHGIVGFVQLGVPHLPAQAFGTAMQVKRAIIGGKLKGLAVELEAGALDTIGYAPREGAEMGALFGISVEMVKAQHNRAFAAGHRHTPVPHHHAIIDQVNGYTRVAHEAELVHALALVIAECGNCDSHRRCPPVKTRNL